LYIAASAIIILCKDHDSYAWIESENAKDYLFSG
jgi:hypothetical protein